MTAARLGELIKRRRLELDLTQVDLANRSGVTQGHISQIEQGRRSPGLHTLQALRVALGVDDELFVTWISDTKAGAA